MLEREREPGQLRWGVRLGGEERTPVERSQSEGRVLQRRGGAAYRLEAFAHPPLMLPGLLQVLGVEARELVALGDLRRPLEHLDRLLLDRVRVREVLSDLLGDAGRIDLAERGVGRPIEQAL